MADYGQHILDDGLGRLNGTWEHEDVEYDLVVEDISYLDWRLVQQYAALMEQVARMGEKDEITDEDSENLEKQAEDLDSFSWEDEDEQEDFVETLITNKLVKPDVDLTDTSSDVIREIVSGMVETWGEDKNVEQAREEMPLEGNR